MISTSLYQQSTICWLLVSVCLISAIDHEADARNLVVIHARKAGGTTTLQWMREIARAYNNSDGPVNVLHFEAYPFIHNKVNPSSKQNFIEFILDKYRSSLFILTVREPIARLLSQYDFEWRMGCQKCDHRNDLPQFNVTLANYMNYKLFNRLDAHKYKYANIEFDDFLDRIEQIEINDDEFGVKKDSLHLVPFSTYLNNYYLWMFCCDGKFCNIDKHFLGNSTKLQECLQTTKQLIQRIDLVLISEWLNDARVLHYVNRMIRKYVQPNCTEIENHVILPPQPYPHALYHDVFGYNKMISESTYRRLQEWNEWDIKLYRYLKQISYDRILSQNKFTNS